jgi:hypothetical protein
VKNLSSVETLGSASVVMLGSGYRAGELRRDGRVLDDPVLLEDVRFVIGGSSLANDACSAKTTVASG